METCCGLGTACPPVIPVHPPLTLHPTTPDQARKSSPGFAHYKITARPSSPSETIPMAAPGRAEKKPLPGRGVGPAGLPVSPHSKFRTCYSANTAAQVTQSSACSLSEAHGSRHAIYPYQPTSPPSGPTHPWPTPVPTEPSSTSVFNSHPQLNTRYSHQDLHQGPLQHRSRHALPANPRAHLLVQASPAQTAPHATDT